MKTGDTVPSFTYEKSPGEWKNIGECKGKVVFITFFATWCGPCREELPHIEKEIYQRYKDNSHFELLVFGREHDWETVNKFRSQQQFSMPVLPDTGRHIFAKFAVQGIPRNFLIDKNGKVIWAGVGYDPGDFSHLKKEIEKALH